MDDEPVWYVAYGSNLFRERFRCYLSGGRPSGGARHYPGCRDPRPARAAAPVTLPGGIYFASTSPTWGGGMAFYDPGLPGRAAARAYLLSRRQFCDVVSQEMWRDTGVDVDLTEAVRTGRQRLGPGRYETVLRVGERAGHPMLTFTAPAPHGPAELNAPAAAYLGMLGNGLREAHGWTAARAASYLCGRPGAAGTWRPEKVAALISGPGRPEAGPPTGARGSAAPPGRR
ncbi:MULTISPECIES: histone deacetylase [Actinomadura]|uniref:Histone deacetylase n=1 Tax=Actinomadura litoris TaxID=2678616 RepID=A0A7K1KWK6_9ACTN|nr:MULTISPECIES: histone deacetylase [Actinomadura]MBT2211528.1 histone deacetylase [Actinomadura sp. NEAU-AAG7]MUN36443.1 histone deacetylase [Actinomadura litoris]